MAVRDKLTEGEMEVVMSVFRQYETGLREACINVKVAFIEASNKPNSSLITMM